MTSYIKKMLEYIWYCFDICHVYDDLTIPQEVSLLYCCCDCMVILTVCVGSPVKLTTEQQLHLKAADMTELRVIMQLEENQCLACFSIIQEDMSRVTAGGGVCHC